MHRKQNCGTRYGKIPFESASDTLLEIHVAQMETKID